MAVQTCWLCIADLLTTSPFSESHNFDVLSSDALKIKFPLGEYRTDVTGPLCAFDLSYITLKVSASQTVIVLSNEPVTNAFPDGWYERDWIQSERPSSTVKSFWPVFGSHTSMEPWIDVDTKCFPFGEYVTVNTLKNSGIESAMTFFPDEALQTHIELSPPEAMCSLSGDSATEHTKLGVSILNLHAPVDGSHFRTVLSNEPENRDCASLDQAMYFT